MLIKRKNEPYKDLWALVGGALYNNEELLDYLETLGVEHGVRKSKILCEILKLTSK